MRRVTKRSWWVGALVVAALGVPLLPASGTDLPAERDLDVDELPAVRVPEYRIIPDDPGPPSAAELLERRLAALAAAVEREQGAFGSAEEGARFDRDGLSAQLTQIVEQIDDEARVSVHVRDLDSNRVLFDYFGDTPLNPASNLKIVTSSAALELLGPDYRFQTRVYRQGRALYLKGEGDPVLHYEDLLDIARLVDDNVDLASIETLYVDDSVFSPRRFGPGYAEGGPGYAYEAPSGALSLGFNSVEVTV
jgi:serine-type D-Ala-D-Ala carboxypeptidase/endopeptidase (penicillin-binding protein 4)